MLALQKLALFFIVAGADLVTVQWSGPTRPLNTTPTLQVVPTPLFERGSPQHDLIWAALSALNASRVRFVPWLPFPRLGVAALEPPSGGALCGFRASSAPGGDYFPLALSCAPSTIAAVEFAAYGESSGYCGNLSAGACVLPGSAGVVRAACLGRQSCTLLSTDAFFGGSPGCAEAASLAVQVRCADAALRHTSWDFSRMDGLVEDFMAAQGLGADGSVGRPEAVIFNPSTPPQWAYALGANQRLPYPDDPSQVTWGYEKGGPPQLVSPQLLGDYFGRVFSHYAAGGFTDESGVFRPSAYKYSIPFWEVLNEPEAEHHHTPLSYTQLFDSVAAGIFRQAPGAASQRLRFAGLALEGHNEWDWWRTFLNASNHARAAPTPAMATFHFYAQPPSRGEPALWGAIFDQADGFVLECEAIRALRNELSPSTTLNVDEMGLILPMDNDARWTSFDVGFPPSYWAAAAAFSAYTFARLAAVGVETVGMSALCCHPSMPDRNLAPFFPSVAILNWTNGARTQRYWGLKLLLDSVKVGDGMAATNVTQGAPGSAGAGGAPAPFCGAVSYPNTLTLACATPGSTISSVQFASYGRPLGGCGAWSPNASCAAANASAVVAAACLGRSQCSVAADTATWGDPCLNEWKFLAVEAVCSAGGGSAAASTGPAVFAQGFVRGSGSGGAGSPQRAVLVVNKQWVPASVTVEGAAGGVWRWTDASTQEDGYGEATLGADTWALAPWAAGFLVFAPP
jgi:hypothetical protein